MEYIAHKDGDRKQKLIDHLKGTAELAGKFADSFGKYEWGYCCGMLHDIGKYSSEFQNKIINDTNDRVDHATAGLQLCDKYGGHYTILDYVIAGHHTGLMDYYKLEERQKKKICNYQAYSKEIDVPELKSDPFSTDKTKNPHFSMSIFMRMLYSCLVDADFLDTENFMKNADTDRRSGESMDVLLSKLKGKINSWLENTDIDSINGRRSLILKSCMEKGEKSERGLFHLTVPTGGGKTIASLAFALNHAVKHGMDHIIYVIPYTSIIEQNAEVFREILGDDNVLENHCNVDYGDSEELKPMQLASENWDKPIIVTTNVQFFESLFGNKSSKCRKNHNIANSVVIFDEAQMLPLNYLKPCIAMLEDLMNFYGTSIVLCTATQPALERFFSKDRHYVELCPDLKTQFEFFKRVTYENIGLIAFENLIARLKAEKRTLCIVNTKKCAQKIYKELEGEGVYHLSTSMYPKHRKRILEQIKNRMCDKNMSCVLISTSLVEAGVDLDFDTVYRQIAGVDSVIQAAGRCNREGENGAEESKVAIFDLEGVKAVPSQSLNISITRSLLQEYEDISDLKCITEYFRRLYSFRESSLDKKNIMGEFFDWKYNFDKVAKEIRLIEEETRVVLVPIEPEAKILLDEFKNQGYSKIRMRKASQYCVQIYDNIFNIMHDAGMIREISPEIDNFYELVDTELYTNDMGLNLSVDSGMDLYL